MRRFAPKVGYGNPQKESYRELNWRLYAKHCPVRPCNARALLLPSKEGLEIPVALRHGFLEDQLYIVDRQTAYVATHKRSYPTINTKGVDLAEACRRLAKEGVRLHVANFDLTSCASNALIRLMADIAYSGVLADRCIVGINILRAREHVKFTEKLRFIEHCDDLLLQDFSQVTGKDLSPSDYGRLGEVMHALTRPATLDWGYRPEHYERFPLAMWRPIAVGKYVGEECHSPMMWLVAGVETLRANTTTHDALRRKYAGKGRRKSLRLVRLQRRNSHVNGTVRDLAALLRAHLLGDNAVLKVLIAIWEEVDDESDTRSVLATAGLADLLDEIAANYQSEAKESA